MRSHSLPSHWGGWDDGCADCVGSVVGIFAGCVQEKSIESRPCFRVLTHTHTHSPSKVQGTKNTHTHRNSHYYRTAPVFCFHTRTHSHTFDGNRDVAAAHKEIRYPRKVHSVILRDTQRRRRRRRLDSTIINNYIRRIDTFPLRQTRRRRRRRRR